MSGAAPVRARVGAQASFEVRSLLRNGEQILVSIVLPLLVLAGLVVVAPDALLLGHPGAAPVDVAVPGVLALAVVSTAFTGQAISVAYERRYGVLRLLGTTPLGRSGLLMAKGTAVLVVVAVQCLVLGVAGLLLGWRPGPGAIALAVPMVLLGSAVFIALSAVVGGRLRAEAVLALANLLWVLFLGCGLVLPAETLPGSLATVALLSPPGALGEGMRAATLGHPAVVAQSAGVMLAWAVVLGLLATRTLRWSD
ncbi:MAG: ABC transporter permease [Ornithinimicrobium sp.]